MPDRPDKPADSYPDNPWPLLAALAVLAMGIGFALFGFWRRAGLLMAGSLLIAGLLRMVLPRSVAGLLVVRRRWFDVSVLFVFGVVAAALVLIVPPGQ